MSASSASLPASRIGPVNHLRAEIRYQPPNRISAAPTVIGAKLTSSQSKSSAPGTPLGDTGRMPTTQMNAIHATASGEIHR